MQKQTSKNSKSALTTAEAMEKSSSIPDILWLRDFLFYRIPSIASHLLRETSFVCANQKPEVSTAQWRIMSILANYPSILAKEISRISMLDEVAVSRALSHLMRRGFVVKKQNRHDKRAREVTLTPAGWRYYGAIMPRMKEQNEIIRAIFSPTELIALYAALDKIDGLFDGLDAQRRLYGKGLTLKDIADRKVSAISGLLDRDSRSKR